MKRIKSLLFMGVVVATTFFSVNSINVKAENDVYQILGEEIFTISVQADDTVYITGLTENSVIPIGNIEFPEFIADKTVSGIEREAFIKSSIEGKIKLPDTYKNIGIHAFTDNSIKGVIMNGVDIVQAEAFLMNDIVDLEANALTTVEQFAFAGSKLQSLDLINLKNVGYAAFKDNEIKSVNLPSLEVTGVLSFDNNKIEQLDLKSIKNIAASAFSNNSLTRVNLYNVEEISDSAFFGNFNLFEVNVNSLPQIISDFAFVGTGYNDDLLGYFNINIASLSEENILGKYKDVIINGNPLTLDTDIKAKMDDNQEYINYDHSGIHVGHGHFFDEIWYCSDINVDFTAGIFNIYRNVETVYIIEQGANITHAKFAFNERPNVYKYSFAADLVSKMVWQLENNYTDLTHDESTSLIWLINSNEELNKVHLTSDNFIEHVKDTKLYNELLRDLETELLTEVLHSVKNDSRQYSLMSYGIYSSHEYHYMDYSQTVFTPGKPIDNSSVDKESPKEPAYPSNEEEDKPVKDVEESFKTPQTSVNINSNAYLITLFVAASLLLITKRISKYN